MRLELVVAEARTESWLSEQPTAIVVARQHCAERRLTYYRSDDAIFVDDQYLIPTCSRIS